MTSMSLDITKRAMHHRLMGLYQDQINSLSELKRLAVLVMDSSRRAEIGADQWPLAMISYGLVTCNDESSLPQGLDIYAVFSSFCSSEARTKCITQLAGFIRQRQGNGWRALLPFALGDEDATIRRQAAFLIGTMAPPTDTVMFKGFDELTSILGVPPLPGQQNNHPLLEALLGTADLRLLPLASGMIETLPEQTLIHLLEDATLQPNALSCEWLMKVLESKPSLAQTVTNTLVKSAPLAEEILDVILPIPSWLFKNASPQPLHGWTRPEFFERMRGRLSAILNEDQLDSVREAWVRSY